MYSIGEKIKHIRVISGLTQKKFAKQIGVSDGHVSNMESGKDFPSQMLIQIISRYFGVSEKWLVDDADGSYPEIIKVNGLQKRIAELIDEHELLPRSVPNGLNVSEDEWFLIVNGNANTNVNALIETSEYFNVSLDWLLKGSEHGVIYNGDLNANEVSMLTEFRKLADDDKNLAANLLSRLVKK